MAWEVKHKLVGVQVDANDPVDEVYVCREILASLNIRPTVRLVACPTCARVEFDLLDMLLSEAGQAISRETLVRKVLGREFSPFDRSIDTHVYHLRHKLGPLPGGGDRIVGIRGIGYLYACSARSSSRSG